MLIFLALGALLGPSGLFAAEPPDPRAAVARGNDLYYQGQFKQALASYEEAVARSSSTAQAWLNGAVVLEETGERRKAAAWYRRAAALSTDTAVFDHLGWAQWRAGELKAAATTFQDVLVKTPDDPDALLGLARVTLDDSRPEEALRLLKRASAADPLMNLVPYYQGKAYDLLGDADKAAEAYRQAVISDSYFMEGRDALGRTYLRRRLFNQAWRQYFKILEVEPRSRRFQVLLRKVRPLLNRKPSEILADELHLTVPYLDKAEPEDARVPRLRVGIGTNALGKPRARRYFTFRVTSDFTLLDADSRRKLAEASPGGWWQVRLKRIKNRWYIQVQNPGGEIALQRRDAILISPSPADDSMIALDGIPGPDALQSLASAEKIVRGELELSAYRGNIRLVNLIGLENYTSGVLAAEMPLSAPAEALKAQAVIARSHALYIRQVSQRHRRQGYDLCDGEHCQVYAGVRAESRRARELVEATRGVIATYDGRVAHTIFSSNCGGRTQSASDIPGWGHLTYWTAIADGPDLGPPVHSPWELRRWLETTPAAYCKTSVYVHPSHFRWTRVVLFKDLEEKLNRKFRIGRLRGLKALRRSPSGNVTLLLVQGSRRSVKVDSEEQIRGMLGLGSLRSTLFVVDTEYGRDGKPDSLVFHGGGWGHAVGLCQSGAMGRAEAGQDYAEIIRAYFKGVELSRLEY